MYRVVAFDRVLTDAEKGSWQKAGWELVGYLPDRAYLLRGVPGRVKAGAEPHAVGWSRLSAEMKLTQLLSNGNVPDYVAVRDRWEVLFLLADPNSALRFEQQLSGSSVAQVVRVETDEPQVVRVHVIPQALRALAAHPAVQFVQQKEAPAEPENNVGRKNHRTNAIQNEYTGGRAYDGTGVVVGHGDDGDIGPHVDFTGRILANYSNASQGNHGDHVAGTILGGGNKDPRGTGN